MADEKRIPTQVLVRYVEQAAPPDTSRIRRDGDKMWLAELYCHRGHSLISADVEFDGHAAVHIRVRAADGAVGPADFYLSPLINDPRKQGPDLPEGALLTLHCPECDEELRKLVPCTCGEGAYRRAVYLTPDPDAMGAVGVCDRYGCPQSFVTEDGELLYEVVVQAEERGH